MLGLLQRAERKGVSKGVSWTEGAQGTAGRGSVFGRGDAGPRWRPGVRLALCRSGRWRPARGGIDRPVGLAVQLVPSAGREELKVDIDAASEMIKGVVGTRPQRVAGFRA